MRRTEHQGHKKDTHTHTHTLVGNTKERGHLRELDVDGRMVLKLILVTGCDGVERQAVTRY